MISIPEQRLNILLIEDEIDTGRSIETMMRESGDTDFSLTRVNRVAHGLDCLRQTDFDIILLDSHLTDRERLEAFARVKKQTPTIPIIVLTPAGEPDLGADALRLGVQDCLPKGQVDRDWLLRSIEYAIARQREKEELQQQIARERLMGRIIERIRSSLDLRHILDTTVSEVCQLLNADRVFIYQHSDKENKRVVAEAGKNRDKEADFFDASRTIQLLEPFLSSLDFQPPPAPVLPIDAARRQLLNSIITVPIWQNRPDRETRLWGQLIARDGSGNRQWQEWEIAFLTRLADRVSTAILQSELYQAVEKQASADGLTGIANRRQFDRQLAEEWQKHARQQTPLSLILCDVDFFKQYNDLYGHLAGDDCLKKVAEAIAGTCRRVSDLPCRYGGEEFAVILPRTDEEGAFNVARAIEQNLRQMLIPHEGSRVSDRLTASIGIATEIPDRVLLPETLIEEADRALREAKATGRNRIVQARTL